MDLPSQNSIFTIATGSQVYLRYALNLARSFALHNEIEKTAFYIVTDQRCVLPEGLSFVRVTALPSEVAGRGVTPKLYLDRLAPTERSLFLDADCLVFRDLQSVFDRFRSRAISVVGVAVSDGNWCGPEAATLCARFGIAAMPRFNGGLYYVERGAAATKVYDTARQLRSQFDALGFHRHRGSVADEPLVSLGMAIHSQEPIADDGDILSDLGAGLQHTNIDVLRGKSVLYNPPPPSPRRKWWQSTRGAYSPAIIHFTDGFPYDREAFKLSLKFTRSFPDNAVGAAAFCRYTAPYWTEHFLKSMGRPVYRKLFGYRPVKAGARPDSA